MLPRSAVVLWSALAGAQSIEFNRDIRPILSDKCFLCHGPDAVARKIPLRLDSEATARRAIASGELLRRVTAADARRMPPPYSNLSLSEGEVQKLRVWIDAGAPWQPHWSFIPPKRPSVPAGVHPVDYFVRQRLEREGLQPAPEAPRETLLRRVFLDLTGLPPAAADLDSREPYEAIVDRLLASPRYGERMAARWLDAARYADTNGYQYDGERHMWRWRDWVIDAFNRNQPFDRFVLEQLAGDLLPGATMEQKIATGFNRNHRINTEDGIIPEEYAVEYVVDRVETASSVFLGLTLGCARCHNHKYDPFTQKEFYGLYAYFNNIPELGRGMKYGNSPPLIPAPTAAQQAELRQLEARIARLETKVAAGGFELPAPDRWAPSAGLEFVHGEPGVFDGQRVLELGDQAGFDIEDRFTISAWVECERCDGPVVSRMSDNPKGKGYGLHLDGGKVHVHLTSVWADDAIRAESEPLAPGRHHLLVTYDGSRMAAGVRLYVDGRPAGLKVLLDTLYRPFRNAGRPFREPLRIGGGWGRERRFRGRIEDVRLYGRILSAGEISALARLPEAKAEILRWVRIEKMAPELIGLYLEKEKLERSFPTVMVMAEPDPPRETHLLLRGEYNKPGEKVERGVPAALPPLAPGAPNNRLGLARWLTGPNHPLLARVTVNRFWQMYFGTGLVKTAEDFGAQGEWPSHPELLDWLATRLIRTGWDVKAMQRLIVTSATYRQSSRATPQLAARDPENRLLARGPRHRLPAEMVRDAALFVSGLLVERIGGPSVRPYQPAGLWKEIAMQDVDYVQGKGEDLYRRSLYTFWKRTVAPPMLANFDAAGRESCVVRETRTNTPLQALNLMNDVTFLEAARFLGQRMMKEGGLRHGFRLVTARWPAVEEEEVLRATLQFHLNHFREEPARAGRYLDQGESRADPALDRAQLAAHTAVASLLLNLDEAITKP